MLSSKKPWCFLCWIIYTLITNARCLWKMTIPMIDTSPRNFDINLNINITNIKTRYQSQYQYCRTRKSISISIPISKIIKFKLNLKTIPRYLDILRSQANTPKIRASIAQLWAEGSKCFFKPFSSRSQNDK